MTFAVVALVSGESVSGNDKWYELSDGYVWSGACGQFQPAAAAPATVTAAKFRPLVPFPELGVPGDVVADDVREPLLRLQQAVTAAGGTLARNSLTRTAAQQQVLRDRYTSWIEAGKPGKVVPAANKPGRSTHQGGRAIDVNIGALQFKGVAPDKHLDILWPLAEQTGWTPIIKAPTEWESEAWHFDWWGSWRPVKDRLGYDIGCLCTALDVGQAATWQSDGRLGQALLLRAGYDIGEPDGDVGPRTRRALVLALGNAVPELIDWDATIPRLRALAPQSTWQRVVA